MTDGAPLDDLERRVAANGAELDDAEKRAASLSDDFTALRDELRIATRAYRDAQNASERARQANAAATELAREASTIAQVARKRWELARDLIQIAAMVDAKALEAQRGGAHGVRASVSCDEGMSTQAFRRLLESQGMSLLGKEIDHIVPKSLGGADHPSNYQIISSSLNESLGARWDYEKCAMPGKERCVDAVRVSRRCGTFRGTAW